MHGQCTDQKQRERVLLPLYAYLDYQSDPVQIKTDNFMG